jgi:hypothetical protein
MSNKLETLKAQIAELDDGHQAKALLEQLLASAEQAKGKTQDAVLGKIEELLGIAGDNDAANAQRRKELFTLPTWMVKGSSKAADAFAWWKQNKALGLKIENGKVTFAPEEVLALPDYSKSGVRNGALADAPDEESARAAAEAVRAGQTRKSEEAENKAEKAREEAAENAAQAAKLEATKEALQAELDDSEAAMLVAQAAAEAASHELQGVTETVRLLETQIGEMTAQKDAADNKATALTARAEEMRTNRVKANNRIPELQTQLEALNVAYKPVEERLNAAQSDYDSAQQDLHETVDRMNTLQTQLDRMKASIEHDDNTHDQLKREIAELEDQQQRKAAEVTELLNQIQSARSQQGIVESNIVLAKNVANTAKEELLQVGISDEQKQLFLESSAHLDDDGTTGIAKLTVRKAKNTPRKNAKALRVEVTAGNLKKVKDVSRPAGVSFLTENGGHHPLVGQGNNAVAYMDGETGELVVRTQSSYPKAAKVSQTDDGKVLLITFKADTSNKVPAHDFTLQVKL